MLLFSLILSDNKNSFFNHKSESKSMLPSLKRIQISQIIITQSNVINIFVKCIIDRIVFVLYVNKILSTSYKGDLSNHFNGY